ncbi:coiled-coil-helix-coiled-coil-helix domain-containing protein 7 [Chelonus insularis]|uniref:coiled-coil-helix-coiled-coil-helix domain-containing protein 7 n=1 Tax=Chelonus insularis TaxID=460826 RepID=UPI00158F03A2|nr:coiled-coil-helix-coiled-coil-helix domain-containing protein 7 [Chelonus insularis]
MSTKVKIRDTRLTSSENNPCLKEHYLSLKCLDDNQYDHDACLWYFENYKNCKGFWNDVMHDRRSKGITPILPPVEEREKMKEEYMKNFNAPKK